MADRQTRAEETGAEETDEAGAAGAAKGSGQAGTASGGRELPKVDFSTLVLSLGTTALCQLGLVADPTTGEKADPDLAAAQQTVDTLEMLREKTRGNLDDEERKLLDSLLYELRMRFVEVRG